MSEAAAGWRFDPAAARDEILDRRIGENELDVIALMQRAGVVRLVFGLGTRAVNRSDDDYTRIVALNAPERRPEATVDEVTEYSQRRVDLPDRAGLRNLTGLLDYRQWLPPLSQTTRLPEEKRTKNQCQQ